MDKPLIQIVEDDPPIQNLIRVTLKANGYRELVAETGQAAILEAATHNPAVILLDLGLPDLDGVEVIRQIRSWTNTPIIVISARTDDPDKIAALDAGADDYLTKPFSVPELLARLRVALRRVTNSQHDAGDPVFHNGALTIDYAAGCAWLDQKELKLTPMEYRLLCLFSRNAGRVLTHQYITQQIWGSDWESNIASLRVVTATLRKKLETSPDSPRYIQTHIGVGYRMIRVEEQV